MRDGVSPGFVDGGTFCAESRSKSHFERSWRQDNQRNIELRMRGVESMELRSKARRGGSGLMYAVHLREKNDNRHTAVLRGLFVVRY